MIGKLDQRVTFERKTRTADNQGGFAETWATLATAWAMVRANSGKESEQAGAVVASASYNFTIRSRSDVWEADRIIWNGETYNIRVVRRGGRAQYMTIVAEFGAAS